MIEEREGKKEEGRGKLEVRDTGKERGRMEEREREIREG